MSVVRTRDGHTAQEQTDLIITYLRENILSVSALLCLLFGLADAAQLLGLGTGPINPLVTLGSTGFIYLAVLTVARLFAAVGLWINASWGGILLVAAGVVELVTLITGVNTAHYSFVGIVIRVALAATVATILIYSWWQVLRSVHD